MTNTKIFTKGSKVMDKVTGNVFLVTDEGKGNQIIDTEVSEISVDLKDPVFYKVLEMASVKDVPEGYDVVNGCLVKDGNPVTEQGQVVINTILAPVPGRLILSVKPLRDLGGNVDIVTYTPSEDRFNKLLGDVPVPDIHTVTDNYYVFVTTKTHMVEKDTDSVPEELSVFDSSYIEMYSASADRIVSYREKHSPIGEPMFILPSMASDLVQIVTVSADAVKYDEEINENVLIPADKLVLRRWFLDDDDKEIDSCGCDDISLEGAKSVDSVTVTDNNSLLIKAGNIIYYTNDGHYRRVINSPLVKETEGFDYLVDAEITDKVNKLTLANKDYETITIKSEKTDDRGIVVSII